MQQQKLLSKVAEEMHPVAAEEESLPMEIIQQQISRQKDLMLPGLDALNEAGKGSPT